MPWFKISCDTGRITSLRDDTPIACEISSPGHLISKRLVCIARVSRTPLKSNSFEKVNLSRIKRIELETSNFNKIFGVSNCYVFKSRLQEYAQKAGILTPVYETTKEGPSHEPCFRSTVTVNNVRYDSLPGFFNRKAAEQSAAEIALVELAKSGNMRECISHPVHETGLCKNLLQEYAQKMNYAIPSYVCHKDETPGKMPYSCTVEIGGIQYIGAAARTKKEAEIKAARTALLAIQAHAGGSEAQPNGGSQYTVVPSKKKGTESDNAQDETAKALKPKKTRFKKKWPKKRFPRNKGDLTKLDQTEQATDNVENASGMQVEDTMLEVNRDSQGVQHVGSNFDQIDAPEFQVGDSGILVVQGNQSLQNEGQGESNTNQNEKEISVVPSMQGASVSQVGNSGMLVADTNGNSQDAGPVALDFKQNGQGISSLGILSVVEIKDLMALVTEVNKVSGAGQTTSMVSNSSSAAQEAPVVMGEDPLLKDGLAGLN